MYYILQEVHSNITQEEKTISETAFACSPGSGRAVRGRAWLRARGPPLQRIKGGGALPAQKSTRSARPRPAPSCRLEACSSAYLQSGYNYRAVTIAIAITITIGVGSFLDFVGSPRTMHPHGGVSYVVVHRTYGEPNEANVTTIRPLIHGSFRVLGKVYQLLVQQTRKRWFPPT